MKIKILTIILLLIASTSCYEINSDDPHKVYLYWSGFEPPPDIELIKAKYWQSAHFTKEYRMYLKLKTNDLWWNEFIKTNNFEIDTNNWSKPRDAPEWFTPSQNSIRYIGKNSFDQGSRIFKDSSTQICYIYEIQL